MSPEHTPSPHCRTEDLHALLLGDLEPSQAQQICAHLAHCPSCQTALDHATAVDCTLREIPSLPCPPHLRVRLATIPTLAVSGPRRSSTSFLTPPRASTLALAALTAAAALVLMFLRVRPEQPPAPIAPPPHTANHETVSAEDLARAQEQVKLALGLLKAAGRESATRAGEKLLETGVVAPARRLGLAFLSASRAPQDSDSPLSGNPPLDRCL